MCVDLRGPNKAVIVDSYPLPHMEEMMTLLQGATVFSTIDLESAYHQVPLHEDSRDLTAFITHKGLFRFCRVPYELASAPSAFQKMMVIILKGLQNVANYLDGIIVWGCSQQEHDAIAFTLHTALSHLENKNTYVRMLFVDYSSAFNTIVPATLVAKLQTLGLNRSLCSWILDFLTGRSQVVRMGSNTSSPLILNTGAPQGCVLSSLLYSLYTHDCTATHSSNVIVKFADDTMVIGLITDNDEMTYREEVSTLTKWCQENHLSLNIIKTKELVVDYRRQSREHTPITINKTPVERVSSFKFLGVHITEDLTWSAHTDAVLKKAHQRLFFLRRLRKFGTSPRILRSFYTCTVESILTGCITAWFGNSTAGNRRALQRVVRTARHIVGGELPSLQDIYTRRCTRKARRIIKDSSHPSHRLLSLLPSGRRFRSIRSRTSRLRDSFFPQAIRLMNSHK